MDSELVLDIKNKLTDIADILYKGNVELGLSTMTEVIPQLSILASGIQDEDLKNRLLQDALVPLLQAMEEKDGTLMADIITYELIGILNEM